MKSWLKHTFRRMSGTYEVLHYLNAVTERQKSDQAMLLRELNRFEVSMAKKAYEHREQTAILENKLAQIEKQIHVFVERANNPHAYLNMAERRSDDALARDREILIHERLSSNGLFVIGHARSGTTILQRALNTSPDIFLTGEANLHMHHSMKGFAQWYRNMHSNLFKNLPGKSFSCPEFHDQDDGMDLLMKMRAHYRYVGDKAAFRSRFLEDVYDYEGAYNFFQKHFLKSHFICTVRDPVDVLGSSIVTFKPEDLGKYAISYIDALKLVMDMQQTFENCFVFIYETMSPTHFEVLGAKLGCDLSAAYSLYDSERQRKSRYTLPDGVLGQELLDLMHMRYQQCVDIFADPTRKPDLFAADQLHSALNDDMQKFLQEAKESAPKQGEAANEFCIA